MADLTSIFREARGIHQDNGRDRVPVGKVYDMIDVVPRILGSSVRGRGKWAYQSDVQAAEPVASLFVPYAAGATLVLILANGNARSINQTSIGSAAFGAPGTTIQNPVFHRDRLVVPRADGTSALRFISSAGVVTNAPVSALTGRLATIFKDRVIAAGSAAEPTTIAASKPGDPTIAWDALSKIPTSLPLTGVASQRNQILCFHEGSVERLRGTTFPDSAATDPTGDMILEPLFDLAGCYDPRSIVNWQDNVIFADARGVHITDGAIVRNMIVQGGIETFWRSLFVTSGPRGAVLSLAAHVTRDLYHVTVRNAVGSPITLCCDIPTRSWWAYSNIDATTYAVATGDEERLWAGDAASLRMIDITPIYSPDPEVLQVDADGTNVLPLVDTGWLRLGQGEEAMKRIKFLMVSYETGVVPTDATTAVEVSRLHAPSDDDHYHLIQGLPHVDEYRRSRVRAGFGSYGLGVRVAAVLPTKDFRLHDVSVDASVEEEHRVGAI